MKIIELFDTHSLLTEMPDTSIMSIMLYHLTPTRNIRSIMQNGLIPRIGRRARLLGESTPAIYLFPSIEDAEDALEQWYGNEFSDNTRLALLAVNIPPGATEIAGAGYERIFTTPIPPQQIKIIDTNFGY
jgi:hypothetical protein